MHYGVVMFPTEYAMAPDELARALEERGFESVWFPEHTHIPGEPSEPVAGRRRAAARLLVGLRSVRRADGGGAARPSASSSAPASAWSSSAIPITMAKEVATLDRLSGGRVLFGIGGGWNAEEMAQPRHRVEEPLAAPARARAGHEGDLDQARGGVPRRVRALRQDLGRSRSRCRSRTRRSSSAATARRTFDRVVEFGDGWMPIMRPQPEPGREDPRAARAAEEGRPRSRSRRRSRSSSRRRRSAALDALEAAGVERAIFGLPSEPRDAVLPRLDAYAAAMRG